MTEASTKYKQKYLIFQLIHTLTTSNWQQTFFTLSFVHSNILLILLILLVVLFLNFVENFYLSIFKNHPKIVSVYHKSYENSLEMYSGCLNILPISVLKNTVFCYYFLSATTNNG